METAEVPVGLAHDAAEVVEVAALFEMGDAVRQRHRAVDVLPAAQMAGGIEPHRVECAGDAASPPCVRCARRPYRRRTAPPPQRCFEIPATQAILF